MPQEPNVYEENRDALDMVAKLIETYPSHFGHIDHEKVACVMITNKERPEKSKTYSKVIGVTSPISIYCSKTYVIEFYSDTWERFSESQKSFMIFAALKRIPEEFDGKTKSDDLKDLVEIVTEFGVNPINNVNLPNLLDGSYKFSH